MNNIRKIVSSLILVVSCYVVYKSFFGSKNNKNNTYIENIGSDVKTLNPHYNSDGTSLRVSNDIFEGLLSYNQKGELRCDGCVNYEVSEDKKTYIFHLRENAKWANGDSVTAEDYVYSLRRAVDPITTATDYLSCLFDIKNAKSIIDGSLNKEELGVFADDKYTLRIELENPNFEFLHYITIPIFLPIHKPTIEKYGLSSFSKPEAIMSNGPYKIQSWVPNNNMILVKNENYWDKDNVKIEKVKFLMITEGSVDLNTFRTGNEHMTYYNIPNREKSEYIKEFGDKYKFFNILCQYKVAFNLNNPKYSDIRVRKAFNLAMDRDRLCYNVIKSAVPSYSVIHENIYNNEFEKDVKNLEEYSWISLPKEEKDNLARKLLMEVGYTKENPLKVELLLRSDELHKNIGSAIQDIYNKAFEGLVKVELIFNDLTTFLDAVSKNQFDMAILRWIADYNLPSNFSMLFVSDTSNNFWRYSNYVVDTLFYDSLSCSQDEYIEKQHELVKTAALDYPIVPFALFARQKLVSDKIEGFDCEKNILDRYSTKDLKFKDKK